jgi:hypothetical protein
VVSILLAATVRPWLTVGRLGSTRFSVVDASANGGPGGLAVGGADDAGAVVAVVVAGVIAVVVAGAGVGALVVVAGATLGGVGDALAVRDVLDRPQAVAVTMRASAVMVAACRGVKRPYPGRPGLWTTSGGCAPAP